MVGKGHLNNQPELIDRSECWIRRIGVAAALGTVATLVLSLWRGSRRPAGRTTGREPSILRRPPFYLLAGAVYLGLCRLLWRPFRITLSLPSRLLALLIGGSLYFSGLALTLWGRFALGKMYDVSSTFGAHLYADHRLVTDGPFAFVRHPMYLGILLTGLGGLLLYRSWTFVFLLTHIPSLVIRARREEEVLAEEFGREWQAYCERTPAWIPHLRQRRPLARLPLAH